MARSRGRPAPARPMGQTRSASTVAAPRTAAAPPPAPVSHQTPAAPAAPAPVAAAPQQPGLFAQMATTAAGVAVGSAVGHTLGAGISSMFGGSSSSAPAEPAQQAVAPAAPAQSTYNSSETSRACEVDARNFTRCLDENNGNMQICDWYLQQLKACQQASSQY
ncbi:hypothetical protein D0Z00_000531 [Geotrichum galactomycetum]|uniref:Uncharacterized protein n=1 Tax=Geotrichum galactomycetum TaxID=27317 RepID=A0ACB6V9J2_9ASCO|nr:hypothetical protein D0Z00_000531 [Geotrichum candidum]